MTNAAYDKSCSDDLHAESVSSRPRLGPPVRFVSVENNQGIEGC